MSFAYVNVTNVKRVTMLQMLKNKSKITAGKQRHVDSQGSRYSSAYVGVLLFIKLCQTKV